MTDVALIAEQPSCIQTNIWKLQMHPGISGVRRHRFQCANEATLLDLVLIGTGLCPKIELALEVRKYAQFL